MATTKKGFMQPVLDRNKKIKPTNKLIFTVKTDPRKDPMNQPNNPLTPIPSRKAVKSIKQAVGKAVGKKGKADSIAKITAAAAAAANKKRLDAEKKKASEEAAKKKAAAEAARKKAAAEAARKKAAIAKQKALADAAKQKASEMVAKEKTSSEPIKMSIKPASEMTVSASSQPSVQSTVNSLGKEGEIQKKLDQAAMSNMQEGKASMRRGGSMKKMQAGGIARPKTTATTKFPGSRKATKEAINNINTKPKRMQKGGVQKSVTPKRRIIDSKVTPKGPTAFPAKPPMAKKGGAIKKMKTGGMVNPNSSVSVLKAAGSKGVRSGVNPKASSSKVAGSRGSGRVNTPPSKAVPTAKRGGMVKKKR